MKRLSEGRLLGLILTGDLLYFLSLIFILWLGKDSPAANFAMSMMIVLYWPVPTALSIMALIAFGQLKSPASMWRIFRLISWSVILPMFVFVVVTFAAMGACHFDWLGGCLPY